MKSDILKFIGLVLLCAKPLFSFGQIDGYWQQEVNSKIKVALNDVNHCLSGEIEIEYINKSPDSLEFIYFHLWPNAYANRNTAFAKQMLENGYTDFHFSKEEERGFINQLAFSSQGKELLMELHPVHPDICKVHLPSPLKSGGSVTIFTPFYVKIPASFSRLGHLNQSYQITQWYPKPAVYDKSGWHSMPYLDQGEFYSEFGTFEVEISLPKNYVVGATGILQNKEEVKWLEEKAKTTAKIKDFEHDLSFPPSDSTMKTLRFVQSNVHDFAWFADKHYHVLRGEVELPHSGRKVTTWAMFTNHEAELWKQSLEYLHDAIFHYSLWVGDYPYSQVTAVDGTLSTAAGMEYPMITIVGNSGDAFYHDLVITHEVGHNWFYGIFGFNERDFPWLDEGLNSFYENRYTEMKYPDKKMVQGLADAGFARFFDMDQYLYKHQSVLAYLSNARRKIDQPINTTSENFTESNYGIIAYGKVMLIMDYLMAYIGDAEMDRVMNGFFEKWKFKHPQPEDFRQFFESELNRKLDWFFEDLINTTKVIDYKIKRVEKDENENYLVTLKNAGEVISPVSLSATKNSRVQKTEWHEGFEGEKTVIFENGDYDKFVIDAEGRIPEIRKDNNTFKLNHPFKKIERLRFQIFGSIENPNKTQVFYSPVLGWNNYDKTMLGMAFYNNVVPSGKYEYRLMPMIGIGSKNLAGMMHLSRSWYPKKLQKFQIGMPGSRFTYQLFPEDLAYNKLQHFIILEFKKRQARSPVSKKLHFRTVNVFQEYLNRFGLRKTNNFTINEARFSLKNNRVLNPWSFEFQMRMGAGFLNTSVTGKFVLSYKKPGKGLSLRLFAGAFPINKSESNSPPDSRFWLSNSTGFGKFQTDYLFDELYLDRNAEDPVFSKQVAIRNGGFRSQTLAGGSDDWLLSANVTSTFPAKIPLKPFASLGLYDSPFRGLEMAGEIGVSLVLVPNIFEIHIPFKTTSDIEQNHEAAGREKFYERITFTLDIAALNPFKIINEVGY